MDGDFLLALNTSTIRPQPILEKIRIAGKTGWQGIELWFDDVDAHCRRQGTLDDIRLALADEGLKVMSVISLKGWLDAEGRGHADALEECRRRLGIAAELNAGCVIAGPPRGPADLGRGGERFRELMQLGDQLGARPAMEFLGFSQSVFRVQHALEIMERSGRADATLVMDPFHIFRGGGSPQDLQPLTASQIAICHFNDVPPKPPREQQSDSDRVMPGDGVFDLLGLLRILRDKGYRGAVSLELFNPTLWEREPYGVAREGLEKVQRLLGAL